MFSAGQRKILYLTHLPQMPDANYNFKPVFHVLMKNTGICAPVLKYEIKIL